GWAAFELADRPRLPPRAEVPANLLGRGVDHVRAGHQAPDRQDARPHGTRQTARGRWSYPCPQLPGLNTFGISTDGSPAALLQPCFSAIQNNSDLSQGLKSVNGGTVERKDGRQQHGDVP